MNKKKLKIINKNLFFDKIKFLRLLQFNNAYRLNTIENKFVKSDPVIMNIGNAKIIYPIKVLILLMFV